MSIVILLLGLLLLFVGAELLVRGASRVAWALGLSPLIVGLTVVAFGTSAPELAVSADAALQGQPEIAVGNVVGSNTFNVLLILGLSALIAPLGVAHRLVRRDVPIMIGASVLVLLLARDGQISRLEGCLLFAGLALYLVRLYHDSSQRSVDPASARPARPGLPRGPLVQIVAGVVLLVLGARWLVDGAHQIAQALGVSELVIGLTIVAVGTSLPELATSLVAAWRRQRDMAVGNIVGSNIFNLLAILGLAAILAPSGLEATPAAVAFDIPVMIAAAVVCLPVFLSGWEIARWEGALLVGYYLMYAAYLVVDATGHRGLDGYGETVVRVVIPLTLVALVVSAIRSAWPRSTERTGPTSGGVGERRGGE